MYYCGNSASSCAGNGRGGFGVKDYTEVLAALSPPIWLKEIVRRANIDF
jgi:hypothetical protein